MSLGFGGRREGRRRRCKCSGGGAAKLAISLTFCFGIEILGSEEAVTWKREQQEEAVCFEI